MAEGSKRECYRSDYKSKGMKAKLDSPSKKEGKGIPPNMPGSIGNSGPKIDIPSKKGDKGAKLPGTPKKTSAPLD